MTAMARYLLFSALLPMTTGVPPETCYRSSQQGKGRQIHHCQHLLKIWQMKFRDGAIIMYTVEVALASEPLRWQRPDATPEWEEKVYTCHYQLIRIYWFKC